jgi:hypothetical protein
MADNAGSYVYVVGNDDLVHRHKVQVAGVMPAGVVIAQGLTGREHVVAMDGGFLHTGEKVTVASVGAPQS